MLEAAVTLDARAEWAVNDRALVYVALDNLTDEDVEVAETGLGIAGYGPPRTLSAGLRLTY